MCQRPSDIIILSIVNEGSRKGPFFCFVKIQSFFLYKDMRKNIVDTLKQYGNTIKDELIQKMKDEGSTLQYTLVPDPVVTETGDDVTLTITLPSSIYFFSEGRGPGKFPPWKGKGSPIYDWAIRHNLPNVDKDSGKFISYDTRSFLIARKIARFGTNKPPHAFLEGFGLKDQFLDQLAQNFRQNIVLDLNRI